jgi:hypothetical protein
MEDEEPPNGHGRPGGIEEARGGIEPMVSGDVHSDQVEKSKQNQEGENGPAADEIPGDEFQGSKSFGRRRFIFED